MTKTGLDRHAAPLALLLGAASATGFAPLDLFPVTLLCLAVWLRLVHNAPTVRRALLIGWAFGVGHFTIGNNWIQHAFTYQDAMPHWLGYLAVVLLALYLAVYPMLAAGLAWRLASPRAAGGTGPVGPSFVLVAGAGWIVAEVLRAKLFTGYAWNPLGTVWLPAIGVARLAAWTGVYALSGLTIFAAGALLLLTRRHWRFAVPVLLATALAAITGIEVPITPVAPDAATPHVRVVQSNLGQDAGLSEEAYARRNLAALARLSGSPARVPRLVVWPEGALRYYLDGSYPANAYWLGSPAATRAALAPLIGTRDILLTGGEALNFDANENLTTATNSIYALAPGPRVLGRYDKAHLVPYGEYLPARPVLSAIGLSRLVPGAVDFAPGPGPRGLTLPGFGPVGFQICYEIIFSGEAVDAAHRPALLFNPSNDSWFGAWGPPQHLAQARMRAIEEGLPILRATPTGISAVIAADGTLLATVPMHRAGAIELPMPPAAAPTPFARAGNAMAFVVAALLLLLAVAMRRRAR